MVKNIFVFPGQGAQENGMLKDIYENIPETKSVFERISSVVGQDITKLLWESDATILARSDNSQLVTATAAVVVMEALRLKGVEPSVAAGFSLGEWPALYASGVLTFEDMFTAVKKRGQIMQEVCENIASKSDGNPSGMSAIIGLTTQVIVDTLKDRADVFAVNQNSTLQTVIAGTADGLSWAEETFKAAGARRCMRLKVAGPFHSPLMQEAADKFASVLADIPFADPRIPLFSNVTGGQLTKACDIKANALKHISSSILWTTEEKAIFEYAKGLSENSCSACNHEGECSQSDWRVLEVGYGTVLAKLWKDTEYAEIIPSFSCGKFDLLESIQA
ncbi:MAG: ACP S-malonyltransferase [Treponemataceae bacterium]